MSCLYAKLHDAKSKEVELEELTDEGLREAAYQAKRLGD